MKYYTGTFLRYDHIDIIRVQRMKKITIVNASKGKAKRYKWNGELAHYSLNILSSAFLLPFGPHEVLWFLVSCFPIELNVRH